ncbi:MAG TPA: RNA polymerase sigma-70 factor [Chloroflexota bacterium]|jgi:RNA polymerase sigma-70 factor (ECF subfamily)|nr:RNA polymerase sigma-70 factor [Chloroflexota bacterium]
MTATDDATATVFEEQRSYLFSIAYRLLGSVGDAEDAVQDTFVRWQREPRRDVQSPRAFLATIVVRLCMDQLRSARARREVYVGPWLPEPLVTTDRADLTETVVLRESLSFAFLLLLEALSPLERAVFVLREVFDYDYADIAAMVDKSQSNCRQIFHRARARLHERQSSFQPTVEEQQRVTEKFVRATEAGDVPALLALLTDDAVSISDGGGKARAALRPIRSRENVVRGFLGNLAKLPPDRVWLEEVNGQLAAVAARGGRAHGVLLLDIRDGQVQVLYSVVNPDKLRDIDRRLAARQ